MVFCVQVCTWKMAVSGSLNISIRFRYYLAIHNFCLRVYNGKQILACLMQHEYKIMVMSPAVENGNSCSQGSGLYLERLRWFFAMIFKCYSMTLTSHTYSKHMHLKAQAGPQVITAPKQDQQPRPQLHSITKATVVSHNKTPSPQALSHHLPPRPSY